MTKKQARKLWLPKFKEVDRQCDSCPFDVSPSNKFAITVGRLLRAIGIHRKPTKQEIARARASVMEDVSRAGEFVCHGTAYDKDMKLQPVEKFRQCKGASKFFRRGV